VPVHSTVSATDSHAVLFTSVLHGVLIITFYSQYTVSKM